MQLSRSKLRASPLRPADKSASCLPSRVIAARATRRERNRAKGSERGGESRRRGGTRETRWCRRGMKEAGEHREENEGKERSSPGGEEHNGACMRTPVFTLCRISRMRTEEGARGYHVLYRKRVCTRAAVTLLYPLSLSLSSVPSADRLSPRGPRTNNCPPVNSRYDTREVGALHLFLRRQSAIVEVASL